MSDVGENFIMAKDWNPEKKIVQEFRQSTDKVNPVVKNMQEIKKERRRKLMSQQKLSKWFIF